jgi:hypothetical protein
MGNDRIVTVLGATGVQGGAVSLILVSKRNQT